MFKLTKEDYEYKVLRVRWRCPYRKNFCNGKGIYGAPDRPPCDWYKDGVCAHPQINTEVV